MDYFTDWLDIIPMLHDTSTQYLTQALTQSFCCTAALDVLWSDSGSHFTSKLFNDFSNQWGFVHKSSSLHYPQSNGKIEATVNSMKKIIRTSWESRSLNADTMCCALLQYCNTPSCKDVRSPRKNCMVNPYKTYCQRTITPLHKSGSEVPLKLSNR